MKGNKILKLGLVVILVISAILLIWGFRTGFGVDKGGQGVDILFYWAYAILGLAVVAWVVVGGIIATINNPKFLIKVGIALVAVAALCFVAYLLAPGSAAVGREGLDADSVLKLTDTVLNLTYIVGAAAIIAIVVGEVRLSITNRK